MSNIERWSQYMKAKNWTHTVDLEKKVIYLFATNEVASLRYTILFKDDDRIILLLSYERRCPEKYRPTMADFANRINYAIPIGFFAVDMKDGEVRYRHSVDVEGIDLNETFIDNFLRSAVIFGRRYYNPIQAIMSGSTIEEAMGSSEKV